MGIKSVARAIGTKIGHIGAYTKRAVPGVNPLRYYKLYPAKPGFGGMTGAALQESPEYRADLVNIHLTDPTEQSKFNQKIPRKLTKARQQTQAIGADLFFQRKYRGGNRLLNYDNNSPLTQLTANIQNFNDGNKNILMQNIRKFYDPDSTDKSAYNQSDNRMLMKAAHDVIYDIMRTRQMIRMQDKISNMEPSTGNTMAIQKALKANPEILSALIALKFAGSYKAQSRSEIVTEIRENKTDRAKAYRAKVNEFIENNSVPRIDLETIQALPENIKSYQYGKKPGASSGGLATLDAKY